MIAFDVPPTAEQRKQVQDYVAAVYAFGGLPWFRIKGRWTLRHPHWLKPPVHGWPHRVVL